MTREEAIQILRDWDGYFIGHSSDDVNEALNMAIKTLEQESILAEVRAEIENDWQLKKLPSSPFSCGLRRAIEIIDKYKAESEEKE